jgi:hypothetical protein
MRGLNRDILLTTFCRGRWIVRGQSTYMITFYRGGWRFVGGQTTD